MADRLILERVAPELRVPRFGRVMFVLFPIVLAACSGGDGNDESGVASIDDIVTSESGTDATAGAESPGDGDEAAVLEFAACMRTAGIDFPDPQVDSEGNVGFDMEMFQRLGDFDEAELEAAFEGCVGLLESVSFGFERIFEADFQDAVLDFAVCMRANGFDMPDPDFSKLATTGDIFSEEIDINDPDFEPAFEECQDTLPGIPGLATE
jgi:hypothetical protein